MYENVALNTQFDPYTLQKLTEYLQFLSQARQAAGGTTQEEEEDLSESIVKTARSIKLYEVPKLTAGERKAIAHPTRQAVWDFAKGFLTGVGKQLAEATSTYSLGNVAVAALANLAVGRGEKGREILREHLEKPSVVRAYEKLVEKPAEKSARSKRAYEIGKEMGEWALPTVAGGMVAGPVESYAALATRGLPVLQRVAPFLARNLVEAPIAVTAYNISKPREERAPLGRELLYWMGTDLVFRLFGGGVRLLWRVLRRELPSDDVLKRVLEEHPIEERPVEGVLKEAAPEAPAAEEAAKATAEKAAEPATSAPKTTPVKPPERHAEKPPSTGTVKKTAFPKAPKRVTLADRLSRASAEKRRLALAVIEDYLDTPEVAQEAREALSLWRAYKTRPDALDDAARRVAAQLDARLGHPANEIEFLRRYKEAVRDAILRSQRTLPRPAGELEQKARVGALRKAAALELGEVEWGHGDLLEAILSAPAKQVKELLKAASELEAASRAEAESALRRLIEQRRAAERAFAEARARELAEAAVEGAEAPAREWPVLEEAEAVPGAPVTAEAPRTAEEAFAEAARRAEEAEAAARSAAEQSYAEAARRAEEAYAEALRRAEEAARGVERAYAEAARGAEEAYSEAARRALQALARAQAEGLGAEGRAAAEAALAESRAAARAEAETARAQARMLAEDARRLLQEPAAREPEVKTTPKRRARKKTAPEAPQEVSPAEAGAAERAAEAVEVSQPAKTVERTAEDLEEEIVEAYKNTCESRFAPLVDALENSSPNARRAASVIDRMKKAGYDVSDAESALEEYRSVKRSDYGDVEEFRDAKEDSYYQVVQTLRDALDEGPQVESLGDLPEKFVQGELAKRGLTAEAVKAPGQAGAPAVPASRALPPEEELFVEWNRVRTGAVPESEVHPALAALKREYEALKQQLADLTADQERRWNEAMQRIREDLEAELADLRERAPRKRAKSTGLLKQEEVIRARYAKVEAETKRRLQKQFLKEQHELRSTIYKYEQDPEFVKQRLNEAYHEARRSGEIVELHSGLHPGAVASSLRDLLGDESGALRLRRVYRARNTGPTFAPVERIGNGVRSLPQSDIDKLPDTIIEIDGKRKGLRQWLEEFDTAAARLNQERYELELRYGPPQLMPPQARQGYDQIGEKLKEIAEKRELLRKPVEEALDLARRGQYSKSIVLRIDNAKLLPKNARIVRIGGEDAFFVWVSPSGKEIKLPLTREFTKLDEETLKAGPDFLRNLWIGLPRDLFGEQVVRAFRNATYMMYHFINDYEKRLYEILKPVIKDRSALERITLLLEGNDVPRATEVERKVAAELRKLYDDLFREFGIDPDRYLKNYAPRIRQAGSVWQVYQATGRPRDLQFFADFERVAKFPLFPRELNALTAGLEYIRRGAQARFLGPVLKEMEKIVTYMHPDKQRIYDEFVNAVLGRPLPDERLVQEIIGQAARSLLGEVPSWARKRVVNAISQYMTHLGYLGTIGGNVMSFLKNTLQQTAAIWVLDRNFATGLKYFQKAYRALATKEGQRLLDFCWVKTMREEVFLEALERRISLATGRPEVGKILQALEDVGFKLYGKAEKLNVSVSYMMKLLYDLERGKPLAEAIEAANKFAADTQFLYGIDSPVFWKGPAGRLFGMLMSYPLNYVRMLAELKRTDPEWVMKTVSAVVGGTALMIGLSKLTGLDFYIETPAATVLEHPVVRIARAALRRGGEFTQETSLPVQMLVATARAIPAAVNLLTGEATEDDRRTVQDFLRTVCNFVPFYTQGRRIYKFWRAARSGWEVADETTGKLTYRFGEVPGWEPGPLDIGARLVPEQYRSLIGPTVEQAERRAFFRLVDVAKGQQERLRDEAFQAWLEGDLQKFLQLQAELVSRGFNPLRMEDIERRLQEAEKTAAERAAEGLPEEYTPEETPAQRILRQILGVR